MNQEEWRPIPGYEGIYSVSSLGRIRRDIIGHGSRPGHILSPYRLKNGYLRVLLYGLDGQRKKFSVHRIVALAFIGSPPDGHYVNHKNGIKNENNATNIEYATPSENMAHALAHQLQPVGSKNYAAKLNEEQVRIIKASGRTAWSLSKEYGVHEKTIKMILDGRRWRHVA